jgi:outer membrane protein TolC
MAQNMADPGAAGMLPTVFAEGSANYQLQNTAITFANPNQPEIQADGAQTIGYTGGVFVAYTLFNGGRRLHTLHTLEAESEDARLRERLAMEATAAQVAARFLDATLAADRLDAGLLSVQLSQARARRARDAYSLGAITRLDLTNAESDLRTDSLRLAEARLESKRALRNLFTAMGLPPDTTLVPDQAPYSALALPDRAELLRRATTSNTAYLRTRNAIYTADARLKAARADLLPTIAAQAGYQYSFTDFEANFLNTSENVGLSASLNLRFYLFDGGRVRRNIEQARLGTLMAATEEARVKQDITAAVANAWDEWITALEMRSISERNLELAELAYSRTAEAQSTGQATSLELRTAQLNLVQARNEISLRTARARLAEINLLFEAGLLLQ